MFCSNILNRIRNVEFGLNIELFVISLIIFCNTIIILCIYIIIGSCKKMCRFYYSVKNTFFEYPIWGDLTFFPIFILYSVFNVVTRWIRITDINSFWDLTILAFKNIGGPEIWMRGLFTRVLSLLSLDVLPYYLYCI